MYYLGVEGDNTMFRKFCIAVIMALALMSPVYGVKPDKPHDKPKPVAVPENWSVSDSLIFSAAALLAFATLTRLKVLRPPV
jgi:hypothetical protein